MRRVMVVALAIAMVAPALWAATLADVTMQDQVTVGDATLTLNGMGVRSKLWIKVYIAGLYLETKSSDAEAVVNSDQVKRIVMHFRTDKATKKKMDAAWMEGFEANSPDTFKAVEARVKTFIGFFGDMKTDDIIELTIVPGEGTHASLNGDEKGLIEGDDFGKALLKVWLGSNPPAEDLKEGLLGS